jgi:hypothetical protein
MASNMLTNLRGPDPGANRQTDAISRLVEPVCKAVMASPIMGAKPPAWIRPPLENGFLDIGGGQAPVRYHRDALGYVHVHGYVTAPAGAAAGAVIATLPPGYRPDLQVAFVANCAFGFNVVGLPANGALFVVYALGVGQGLAFSFSFLAEK